jgi:hypothetical protein
MKSILLLSAMWGSGLLANPSDEALWKKSFEGMFEPPTALPVIDSRAAEPMPPVPMDGGVVMLLGVGIALARKRMAR